MTLATWSKRTSTRAILKSGKVIAPDPCPPPARGGWLRTWSRTRNELVPYTSLRISFFWHIMPCACGVLRASAACDGFGFARKGAAPFNVFYWFQITNFEALSDLAPKGANHFDVWDFGIHAKCPPDSIAFTMPFAQSQLWRRSAANSQPERPARRLEKHLISPR